MTTKKLHVKDQLIEYEEVAKVLNKIEEISISVEKNREKEGEERRHRANHPFVRTVATSAR